MRWILVWFLVAPLTAGPAMALLYVLGQRGELGEDEETAHARTVVPDGSVRFPGRAQLSGE